MIHKRQVLTGLPFSVRVRNMMIEDSAEGLARRHWEIYREKQNLVTIPELNFDNLTSKNQESMIATFQEMLDAGDIVDTREETC